MAERPLSPLALYAARPTIRINGAALDRIDGLLTGMEMFEQEDGLSRLELRLTNVATNPARQADFAFEDERAFTLGDTIAVYGGDETSPTELFRGIISGLEADFPEEESPAIVILAEDGLQQARRQRRTRTHESVTLSDLARRVAGDLALTPQISGFTERIGTQVQLNESDLAFLRRILARYDGDLQVVGNELHVFPRGDMRRSALELAFQHQLRRVTVLADLAHQVSQVSVTGWDAARGRRIQSTSTGAQRGPGHGRVGADLLGETLGRRDHQISHLAVADEDEARALADAAFDERQRRFVTLRGTAEGNPELRVGIHVSLTGLSQRFSNTYYVTWCCHRFDLERGYETDFRAESAFLGES